LWFRKRRIKAMNFRFSLIAILVISLMMCSIDDKKTSIIDKKPQINSESEAIPVVKMESKKEHKPLTVPSSWICYLDDSQKYADTLKLYSDSTFSKTEIEMDDVVYGKFILKSDTLTLNVLRGKWDKDFKEGSRHRTSIATYVLVQTQDDMLDQQIGSNLLVWEKD